MTIDSNMTRKLAMEGRRGSTMQRSLLGQVPPGQELVGETITIRWVVHGELFAALVVGWRMDSRGRQTHKVWYPLDHTLEDVELAKRDWMRYNPQVEGWDRSGLVGRRVVQRRPTPSGVKNYEAFVVEHMAFVTQRDFVYRVLRTVDDEITVLDLGRALDEWELLEPDATTFRGERIETWSTQRRGMLALGREERSA